jgi:Holliday junction resolvase RusA-like endonuclease
MTYYIKFEIPGKVKAKQSFKIGRNGFKYTPADVKEYANWVRLCFNYVYPNHLPSVFFEKQLRVTIDCYFAIPKSFSKIKRKRIETGLVRPQVKPDCDNIAKQINDALNGIAFPDDKQIVSLEVNKHYADDEKTVVCIYTTV